MLHMTRETRLQKLIYLEPQTEHVSKIDGGYRLTFPYSNSQAVIDDTGLIVEFARLNKPPIIGFTDWSNPPHLSTYIKRIHRRLYYLIARSGRS